jgi:hypothetical protein
MTEAEHPGLRAGTAGVLYLLDPLKFGNRWQKTMALKTLDQINQLLSRNLEKLVSASLAETERLSALLATMEHSPIPTNPVTIVELRGALEKAASNLNKWQLRLAEARTSGLEVETDVQDLSFQERGRDFIGK